MEVEDVGEKDVGEKEDEFEFPLFSMGGQETSGTKDVEVAEAGKETETEADKVSGKDSGLDGTESESRGRLQTMKVTLREESVERVKNERPAEYYFAQYSEEVKRQFAQAAVEPNTLHTITVRDWSHKVLDLNQHNHQIELEKAKSKRPGKAQRMNKIRSKERVKERQRVHKQLEIQKQRLLKKKVFHKRGGKKHKKKAVE